MPNTETTNSNYTLLKLIRTGISPLSAMIGISSYYGHLLNYPILGSINALFFSKKLGIDIWNINQHPTLKNKLINIFKKITIGLSTTFITNYIKWNENNINPIIPTTPIPTTTVDPFPPDLLFNINTNNDNNFMDWDTYISLNAFAFANLISAFTELIPNRFENIRKICNMATGGCLISSGVAMGINNDFNNAYAVPTIVAGASEIIHNLLPMETTNHIQEMQETAFNNETRRLINDNRFTINSETSSQYGANMSDVLLDNASLNWDYNHMSL
ncbi:hypothetical protein [Spiroplasma endosymbiont of Amphimallon solstitiale]|uniref:hypothetical protein n=1 Tax=Spiroplasma endosymbiont of Amphimallon solstitiale TaxID=3066288 RepID=UPI00313B6071